jgi:predicted nuclease of predicted toxin-antitoxin system
MGNKLYADVHVRRAVVDGLRLRGVDILTAQEDETAALADPLLLDRALALGRIIFTQDDDFLREANRRQKTGEMFGGVAYAHQLNVTVSECIENLLLIAEASEWDEWLNRVAYIPLK